MSEEEENGNIEQDENVKDDGTGDNYLQVTFNKTTGYGNIIARTVGLYLQNGSVCFLKSILKVESQAKNQSIKVFTAMKGSGLECLVSYKLVISLQ